MRPSLNFCPCPEIPEARQLYGKCHTPSGRLTRLQQRRLQDIKVVALNLSSSHLLRCNHWVVLDYVFVCLLCFLTSFSRRSAPTCLKMFFPPARSIAHQDHHISCPSLFFTFKAGLCFVPVFLSAMTELLLRHLAYTTWPRLDQFSISVYRRFVSAF